MNHSGIIKNFVASVTLACCVLSAHAQLDMVTQEDLSALQKPLNQEEIAIKKDPKQSFRNLFSEGGPGIRKYATARNIHLQQLNPQAMSFVQGYMKRHENYLKQMQQWGAPYFDMMDDVLTQNGIPKQLKYLAVIESNLRATEVSWAGAVGPWQFMPETARAMGLQVNASTDERTNYLKSTRAASKYLNYLYGLYKDWLLVVAAYNCGPGRVNSAIARARSNDFWQLQNHLPFETRNHVKKFIATHYIMEGRGGAATASRQQKTSALPNKRDSATPPGIIVQTVEGRYLSKAVAKLLEMNLSEFNKLNPGMDQALAARTPYQLWLPAEKAGLFLNKKNEMLNESILMILNSRL